MRRSRPCVLALPLALLACGGGGTAESPELPAPAGLTARAVTELGEGVAHLTWQAVPGAATYLLSVLEPGGSVRAAPVATGPAATLRALTPGATYTVRVAAESGGRGGQPSAPILVRPPVPPAAPTALATVDRYDAGAVLVGVQLTWTATADPVDGYRVFRSADGGGSWEDRGTTAATSHEDALGPDEVCQRFRFRVSAYRSDASSARSTDEAVRGTVLASSASIDAFDTETAKSPYLVEDSVVLQAPDLRVNSRTTLCIGPGGSISLPGGSGVSLWGLVRAVGEPSRPARILARAPASGQGGGLRLFTSPWFDDDASAHYDAVTGRGSRIEYAEVGPLAGLGFSARTLVRQVKFTALPGGVPATIGPACPRIEDSTFDGFWLTVTTSCTTQANAALLRNRFAGAFGRGMEVTGFTGSGSPTDTFAPGQVTGNSFGAPSVMVHDFLSSGALALGGNHWGGTPQAQVAPPAGGTIAVDFAPVLSSPPPSGATW